MNIRKMFSKVGEKVRGFFTNKKKILATVAVCATVVAGVTGLQTNKLPTQPAHQDSTFCLVTQKCFERQKLPTQIGLTRSMPILVIV